MTGISPLDALALVQLRTLHAEALKVAQSPSPVTRLLALILLDAVNEHTMRLAADTRGVDLKQNVSFDGLKDALQKELQANWSGESANWRDVRRLHSARNTAQHHGVGADPRELAAWIAATDRHINFIVAAGLRRQAGLRVVCRRD